MQRIDLKTAEALINFSGVHGRLSKDLAEKQLHGAVALHNMLASNGVAYLADEVGMGKTYIALGVIALMKRFNPQLRVLYLLPKNNVRDKWEKDYKSFVEQNYKVRDFNVKGLGHSPAAKYKISKNLPELINFIANDSARDHFICTSAFSFSLGNTRIDLKDSLLQFIELLPQSKAKADKLIVKLDSMADDNSLEGVKREVKHCWASALNSIMPRFDLVVVDESHNLKKNIDSSDRNQLLAMLMGADAELGNRKAERVLFLSATPYDRDLDQLRNQFSLFGKDQIITLNNRAQRSDINDMLKKFMIRRLNEIKINDRLHTRNMYRREHRSGKKAEIDLKIEQQLFAAILQKKVNESLNENYAGKFELGMLASFESYLPGERGRRMEFDGADDQVNSVGGERDVPDRTIVQCLVEDYLAEFKERPPHPKMDAVAIEASQSAFKIGKKQLIFVRRVRSVTELKSKIEYEYDKWIGQYLESDKSVYYWFNRYQKLKPPSDGSLIEEAGADGEGESTPSTFFTWFYRGKNSELAASESSDSDLVTLPHNFRSMLSTRSMMFEINWANLPEMPSPNELKIDWSCGVEQNTKEPTPQLRFRHLQYAYLKSASKICKVAQLILNFAYAEFVPVLNLSESNIVGSDILRPTFFDKLLVTESLQGLFPRWGNELFEELAGEDSRAAEASLKRVIIFQELIGVVCRIDHPFIDLYSLRNICTDGGKVSAEQNDNNLIDGFIKVLSEQVGSGFSSFGVFKDISENLDLLIKLNFEDAYHMKASELTRYLSNQISPLSPVVGATGENSQGRSQMARKFRMPGYPCVLVSTDVFQEGEDLHTFCDSVIHYGISASPIALEQKIGRVDRIGSQSHRAISGANDNHEQHFIQVIYPHIPQSLEYFQVRQASSNLNDFHRSLHILDCPIDAHGTTVDVKDHLLDESAIPLQILEHLNSPFDVSHEDLKGNNYFDEVIKDQESIEKRLSFAKGRIEICLSSAIGNPVELKESILGFTGKVNGIDVLIKSAQGWSELLLSLTKLDNRTFPPCFDGTSPSSSNHRFPSERLDYLKSIQSDERIRYQLFDEGQEIRVQRNVEVYVGGENILSDIEVQDVLYRLDSEHYQHCDLGEYSQSVVSSMVSKLCTNNEKLYVSEHNHNALLYEFKVEGRRQIIYWLVKGSYILVTSKVINTIETLVLAQNPELLLNSTLRRNSIFDVVDFYINEKNELCVRALYPLAHLNIEELSFIFSAVACEADRLQYILKEGEDEDFF